MFIRPVIRQSALLLVLGVGLQAPARDLTRLEGPAWPEFWSDHWYANDDVYIDYNDGYYLHNRRHPGVSLAISVSL